MKEIPLSQGKFAMVDDEDFEMLSVFTWYYSFYGYAVANHGNQKLLMHRVIMQAPDGLDVDHIDANRVNNVRSNLRIATHQENLWNAGKHKRNTSGFIGVSLDRSIATANKWKAYLSLDGKLVNIGRYPTREDAARAHDEAAKKHHGKFARLNFP